jgi:hypothetical protein
LLIAASSSQMLCHRMVRTGCFAATVMCFIFDGYFAVVALVDALPPSLLLEGRLVRLGGFLPPRLRCWSPLQ